MNSFDWEEFLILAEELEKRGDEASLRSAISRAYYSTFHMALYFCQFSMVPPFQRTQGGDDHYLVRQHIAKHRDPEINKIRHSLFTLYINRRRADYDDTYPSDVNAATVFSLTLAKGEIEKLKNFAQSNHP